jgi:serpin B
MFLGVAFLGIVAIGVAAATAADGYEVAESAVERDLTPNVAAETLASLVVGNSAFAFDLYQALRCEEGNLFFSPYSISAALAMAYAGAKGETETQMADVLGFLPQEEQHPAFNALDLALRERPEGADEEDRFELNIANALWGQRDYVFLSTFLDVLAANYGAGLHLLDFRADPEGSRLTINDWVADQTNDRILNLLTPGTIQPETLLVLTNAIYFLGKWAVEFDPAFTNDEGVFRLMDCTEVIAPMMSQRAYHGYVDGEGYQAVELAYRGSTYSMVLMLPDPGWFEAFESTLTAARFEEIVLALEPTRLDLALPKFTFEDSFRLGRTLAELGMADAFNASLADFSGMDGTREIAISDVVHKAFVAVDEEGTEAAAATAVIMVGTSAMPEEPIRIAFDRPFLFAIRDQQSGIVLFLGRVLDPS